MNKMLLQQYHLSDIIKEITKLFDLDNNEAYKIILDSISEIYKSDYPVLLEDDGIYAVFNDKLEKDSLKFSKIKYSAKKSLMIISKIQEKANKFYLKKQKNKVISFVKNKKAYLHAVFSYTVDNQDYYELYYDRYHKHMISNVKAMLERQSNGNKKSRAYIDFTSARYEMATVIFKEQKNYKTIENLRNFTRDISNEVLEKIQKKVWIDIRGVNLLNQDVYVHLPYMCTREIIEHIENRFDEVFGLCVVLIYE